MKTIARALAVWTVAFFAATAAQAIAGQAIPFAYFHHEVTVATRINNTGPYTFLLDTDTTPSAIDLTLARRLHLRFQGPSGSGSGTGSGKSVVFPLTIDDVSVGDERARHVEALAADLTGLSKHFGRHLDGVLGTSFLDGRVTVFDYPCRTVTFLNDAPLVFFTSRFRDVDGENVIDDASAMGKRVSATLDTGDGGAAFVTATGIAHLHLEAAMKHGRSQMGFGYNGGAIERAGRLSDVRVGRVNFGSLPAAFTPSAASVYDINVGNRAMERFVVVFDYPRHLITILQPTEASQKNIEGHSRCRN